MKKLFKSYVFSVIFAVVMAIGACHVIEDLVGREKIQSFFASDKEETPAPQKTDLFDTDETFASAETPSESRTLNATAGEVKADPDFWVKEALSLYNADTTNVRIRLQDDAQLVISCQGENYSAHLEEYTTADDNAVHVTYSYFNDGVIRR